MIGGRTGVPVAVLLYAIGSAPLAAQLQSSGQRRCITSMNDAAADLLGTQLLVATKCLEDAAKGRLPAGQTAAECLTADNKGKLARVTTRTAERDATACTDEVPDFGYTGAPALTDAAVAGALGIVNDLYGADLDAAVIDADGNRNGALCQAAIAKAVTNVAGAMLGEFRTCTSDGLRNATIVGETALALCFNAIDTDARGKVTKALATLDEKLASTCASTVLASAIPGDCAGAADGSACLETVARCRVCETCTEVDGFIHNCDLFDDAFTNSSCTAPECIDEDGDSYGDWCGPGTDCNDSDAAVNPAAPELCNAIDDDCNGQIDDMCTQCAPSPEVCDGCDNDCDGVADDGSFAAVPCGIPNPPNCSGTLTCQPALKVSVPGGCASGGLGACNNDPWPEICDGADNDCNGVTDDGVPSVPCVPPSAPPGLDYSNTSQCERGQTVCVAGATECVGWVGPSAEVCDGIDNDCDGVVDDLVPGVGLPCGFSTPPCMLGVTACVSGALICQGGVVPQPEICDGLDNNCNGTIDDAPLADAPAPGQNGCWSLPGSSCNHVGLNWDPPPGATCNALGTLTPPCSPGTLSCGGGAWTCEFAISPSPEVCNGVDDDCDGSIDEGSELCGGPGSGLTCQGGGCVAQQTPSDRSLP